jgi:hypothetical protein
LQRVDDAPGGISHSGWHETLRKNRRTVGLENASLTYNLIQNERYQRRRAEAGYDPRRGSIAS